MKKIVLVGFLVFPLIGCFILSSCNTSSQDKKVKQIEKKIAYQCPMDCESGKTYEKPGKCPVCEMDFDKVEK